MLLTITRMLEDSEIQWLAIGELGLFLYNISQDFNKIEILVSEDMHSEVHEVFSKSFATFKAPEYIESRYYASNTSIYYHKILQIDVFSGIVLKLNENTASTPFTLLKHTAQPFPFHGIKIAVPSLEWFYLFYYVNPLEPEIFHKIIEKLHQTGINYVLLNEYLKFLPENEKNLILKPLRETYS